MSEERKRAQFEGLEFTDDPFKDLEELLKRDAEPSQEVDDEGEAVATAEEMQLIWEAALKIVKAPRKTKH